MDVIKWQLNFGSCNFGLKAHLWFQIELALRAKDAFLYDKFPSFFSMSKSLGNIMKKPFIWRADGVCIQLQVSNCKKL